MTSESEAAPESSAHVPAGRVSTATVAEVESQALQLAGPAEPQPPQAILELYEMAVDLSDRVSARRATANAFFLSVQTAFLGVMGIGVTRDRQMQWWAALALALAGVSISTVWWMQLRSYRVLNRAKFDVINSVEPQLPLQIFSSEWEILSRDAARPGWFSYQELGATERKIPWIFAALHVTIFLGIVCS